MAKKTKRKPVHTVEVIDEVSNELGAQVVEQAKSMLVSKPPRTHVARESNHILANTSLRPEYSTFSLFSKGIGSPLITFNQAPISAHLHSAFAVVTYKGAQVIVPINVADIELERYDSIVSGERLGQTAHWNEPMVKGLVAAQFDCVFAGLSPEDVQLYPNLPEGRERFSLAQDTNWTIQSVSQALEGLGEFIEQDDELVTEITKERIEQEWGEDYNPMATMMYSSMGLQALDTVNHHYPLGENEKCTVSTTIASRFNVVVYLDKTTDKINTVFVYDVQAPYESCLVNLDLGTNKHHRVMWSQFYLPVFRSLSISPVNAKLDYPMLQRLMFSVTDFHFSLNLLEIHSQSLGVAGDRHARDRWLEAFALIEGFLVSLHVAQRFMMGGYVPPKIQNPLGAETAYQNDTLLKTGPMRGTLRSLTMDKDLAPEQSTVAAYRGRVVLRDINYFWMVVLISMTHLLPKEIRDGMINQARSEMLTYQAMVAAKDRQGFNDPF